jgi:hypothetical protein
MGKKNETEDLTLVFAIDKDNNDKIAQTDNVVSLEIECRRSETSLSPLNPSIQSQSNSLAALATTTAAGPEWTRPEILVTSAEGQNDFGMVNEPPLDLPLAQELQATASVGDNEGYEGGSGLMGVRNHSSCCSWMQNSTVKIPLCSSPRATGPPMTRMRCQMTT